MSLTSYRAAPPRDTGVGLVPRARGPVFLTVPAGFAGRDVCEWVLLPLYPYPPAAMPGDDLLFHRLSDSTIGAVEFHGRVRDGIGWDTDAMATRQ